MVNLTYAHCKKRIQERYEESVQRLVERRGRSATEQLALLDARLGKGVGAMRERRRLAEAK